MLASLHPNSPTTDQAVKDLLDQRARASHTRYASLSFSQRSDSPSIYSRGDFSPNPLYMPRGSHTGFPTSVGDQSIFDDAEEDLRFPAFDDSSIDLRDQSPLVPEDEDEDDGMSFTAPTPKPALRRATDPLPILDSENSLPSVPSEEVGEDSRMSVLGPKMRFVSRAPWETGGDDLLEEDEEEPRSSADTPSIFGGKVSSWMSRDQDKVSSKGLGLSTFRSRSPGPPSALGRKGGVNFGLNRHKIPEPQIQGPYGPHLTGASQSHNAVLNTLATSSRSSHSVTDSQSSDNFVFRPSFQHSRPGSTSPSQSSSHPPLPFVPVQSGPTPNDFYSMHDDSSSSHRSDSPPPPARFVHPYANPDVLPNMAPPPSMPLPRTPSKNFDQLGEERDRDRYASLSPRRASESPLSSPRPITPRKASVPILPSRTTSGVEDYGEENMYPFAQAQARTTPSSPVRSIMAHADQPGSPMRNLITLEQARARASQSVQYGIGGQRGNNASTSMKSNPTSTLVAGLGLARGVVVESGRRDQARPTPVSFPRSDPPGGEPSVSSHSQHSHQSSHQRPRTASSGKHMFGGGTSGPDGDVVPGKTLKHKKSAFMKLFQGGKDKERDREQAKDLILPSRAMSTPPLLPPSASPVPPIPSVHNIKRIPPPLPLSVVVTSPSTLSPPRAVPDSSVARTDSPPRHRQASSPLPSSSNHDSEPSYQGSWPAFGEYHRPNPSHPPAPVSSAPPSQTTFTTLSLRPVSTLFSAKFPELLNPSSPPLNPPTILEKGPSYPSPTTPGFDSSRSNSFSTASDFPLTPTSVTPTPNRLPAKAPVASEDQSAKIATLQEQITNSRIMWQRQIWELEGQVRDLTTEVEELRNTGDCETCGKTKREGRIRTPVPQHTGVVDRPRPRMGGNTRSVFGGGSDM